MHDRVNIEFITIKKESLLNDAAARWLKKEKLRLDFKFGWFWILIFMIIIYSLGC